MYAPVHVTLTSRPVLFCFTFPPPSLSHPLSLLEPTCIVRPEMPFASWTSLSLTGPQRPRYELPALTRYAPTQREMFPSASSPVSRISRLPPGPRPNGFHLPARLWNYSGEPITPSLGTGSAHLPVTRKPALHSPFWFSLLPSTAPWAPVWCVVTVSVHD